MIDSRAVELVAALATTDGRAEALSALAEALGYEAGFIFVEDEDVDALVPATGLAQTLPGGPAWRAFLREIRTPGIHSGQVAFPRADDLVEAVSCSGHGAVLVLVGGAVEEADLRPLCVLLPLIGATLRAEQVAAAASGELAVARDEARHVSALARSLDAARADLERQAKALDVARANAELATRAKDEFLAMLGHELRNPLAPIVTALHVMRLDGHDSREMDILDRQVAHLSRLVDDLLDIARITRGTVELRKAPVEVADAALRAIEAASPLFEEKRQILSVDIPESGLQICADADRLAQVFSNLLTNASRYSDLGRRIVMSARQTTADLVEVSVQDEGVGIEPQLLETIFERFVQEPRTSERVHGGLGLGLAIAKNLVEAHDGRITAQSEGRDKGSRFSVELPLYRGAGVATEVIEHQQDSEVNTGMTAPNGERRVLIVDDNVDAAEMLELAVSAYGYDTAVAEDGPTALEIAQRFRPSVAVLDIGLPVMDGYTLGRKLREEHGGEVRLVALTGYGQPSDEQRSRDAGFEAHLVKPVELNQLRVLLQQLFEA